MSESGAVQGQVGWQLGQAVVVEFEAEQTLQAVQRLHPQPPQIVVAQVQYLQLGLKYR